MAAEIAGFAVDNIQYTEYATPPGTAPTGVADAYSVLWNGAMNVAVAAGVPLRAVYEAALAAFRPEEIRPCS